MGCVVGSIVGQVGRDDGVALGCTDGIDDTGCFDGFVEGYADG